MACIGMRSDRFTGWFIGHSQPVYKGIPNCLGSVEPGSPLGALSFPDISGGSAACSTSAIISASLYLGLPPPNLIARNLMVPAFKWRWSDRLLMDSSRAACSRLSKRRAGWYGLWGVILVGRLSLFMSLNSSLENAGLPLEPIKFQSADWSAYIAASKPTWTASLPSWFLSRNVSIDPGRVPIPAE